MDNAMFRSEVMIKGGASIQGYIIELSGVEVLVGLRTASSNEAMCENASGSAARAAG
jgi:hypothetical protein